MYVLDEKKKCTGCFSCAQICPTKAISRIKDDEGFCYPEIDVSLCIKCNICTKICPQLSNRYLNVSFLEIWGGVVKSKDVLLKSSSGGAFTSICNTFDDETIICGVTYDEKLNVHHEWCKNDDEIDKFRKSKYLQSDVRNIYIDIKNFLKEGKTVLFTGTACQVDGLYAYLGFKHENLYTVDLICHGVPNQDIFNSYIKSLEKRKNMDINYFSFRDKSYFWGDWEIGTRFGNEKNSIHQAWGEDLYMTGFLRGLFYRPSCYHCKYSNKNISRPSDLTIGDFWGSGTVDESMNDKKGSSLIVVNSEKGKYILNKMNNDMNLCQVSMEQAVSENHNLIEPTKEPINRRDFFESYKMGDDFIDIMIKYRKVKSHSQKVRVITTKLFPWLVEIKRKKVRKLRKNK